MNVLLGLPRYESIEAFYNGVPDEARRLSGESDFGVWWYDGEQAWSGCWRISCVKNTGEIYAVKQKPGRGPNEQIPLGTLLVLGCVGPEGERYEKSHAALVGWENVCGLPCSLQWAAGQLAPYRRDAPADEVTATAERVVSAVLDDLERRKGIKNELEAIEPEIYAEMRAELVAVVRSALAGSPVPG